MSLATRWRQAGLSFFYDDVFESRQRGDYQPIVSFEPEQVEEYIHLADGFLREMEKLFIQSAD